MKQVKKGVQQSIHKYYMVMFEELQVMTAYPYSNDILVFKLLEEKSISLGRRAPKVEISIRLARDFYIKQILTLYLANVNGRHFDIKI